MLPDKSSDEGPSWPSLDKDDQIYGHGWNLNMSDIECIFNR